MKFLQASVGSAFIAAANPHRSVHHHLIIKYIQFVSSSYCHLMIIDKIYVKLRKLQHPRNDTFSDCKNPTKNTHTNNAPKNLRYMISETASEKTRFFSKSKVNYLEGTFQSVQSSFFCWLGCIKDLSAADRGDIVWEGEMPLTGPRNLLPQD